MKTPKQNKTILLQRDNGRRLDVHSLLSLFNLKE